MCVILVRHPLNRLRGIPRECMAEFFGTMVLIIFGDGVVAQMVVSSGSLGMWRSSSSTVPK
jgi:aquaglyceroporin related protein